jgi:long-subunit fatty acid transport protein
MQTSQQPPIDYKQLYEQQIVVIEKMTQQLDAHFDKVATLSAEITKLRKMIFGVKIERFVPSANATARELQLALELQAETVAQCKITSATTVGYFITWNLPEPA